MRKIGVFDTSIASDNLGDSIIMESITKHLQEIYSDADFIKVPTHIGLNGKDRVAIKETMVSFVGGTNLLCANWMLRPQWKIGIFDALTLPHPVLMGVGWKFYQRSTDCLTAILLRKLLSKKHIHSVRDSYTEQRLRDVGINNVINTACPTMWGLTPEHCSLIATKKAENVMTTVTAYRNNPELDKKWLEILLSSYKTVYLWPQMQGDAQYVEQMNLSRNVEILEPTLAAYDSALSTLDVDFLGTRLHGGIRALHHKKRALIIEIDNRAVEIARDTGLPTIKRDNLEGMKEWIEGNNQTRLTLPCDNIKAWKVQFS